MIPDIPSPNRKAMNNGPVLLELQIRRYEPLLNKIVISFGFNDKELHAVVEEVCSYAIKHNVDGGHNLSLKMWLSKLIVHQCVFRKSCVLFSQNTRSESKTKSSGAYGDSRSWETHPIEMPLSFRTVYLLKNIIGFDEAEIAVLLNSNLLQVRERLNKALALINHQ